jgi:hypothetical protein
MSFEGNTTLKRIFVGNITRPVGGGVATPLALPRTGILARIWIDTTGSIAGSLSNANAGGMASLINRVRVTAQGGQDLFNMSGLGYHYLYRPMNDLQRDILQTSSPFAAVTATTFDVSMVLPLQVNMRDHAGLFMLQNEQTLVTINLDYLADATAATGATVTQTTKVYADIFTVPPTAADWPDMSLVHQVLEDQLVVSGAGNVIYEWPRGSIYLRMGHGLGINQSGSDYFTSYQIKRNESDIIYDVQDTVIEDKTWTFIHGTAAARKAGVFGWEGLGWSGLGSYGMARDTLDSHRLTNMKTSVVASAASTLYSVRDTLLDTKNRG